MAKQMELSIRCINGKNGEILYKFKKRGGCGNKSGAAWLYVPSNVSLSSLALTCKDYYMLVWKKKWKWKFSEWFVNSCVCGLLKINNKFRIQ